MEVICGYAKIDLKTESEKIITSASLLDIGDMELDKYQPEETIPLSFPTVFTADCVDEAVRRILSLAASECIGKYGRTGNRDDQSFNITFYCEEIGKQTGCTITLHENEWNSLEYLTSYCNTYRLVGFELCRLVFQYLQEHPSEKQIAEKK